MTKCKLNPTDKTNGGRSAGSICGCLVSFVVLILMTLGVVAFNLRHYTDSSDFYTFHRGDQISMNEIEADDFSTILCQEYRVNPWTKANVYLLHSEAKVDKHHKKIVRKQLAHGLFPADNNYNYDSFYLLKHSEISVNACMSPNQFSLQNVEMVVMLFKGKDSWKTWQQDEECGDCALMTLTLTEKDSCTEGRSRTMKYKAHHTDNYYVAVARKYKRDLQKAVILNVDLLVERSTYKLERIKEFCPNTMTCNLNLTYWSEEDVVVEIGDEKFSTDAFFTTHCRLRVLFWVGIFAILPTALILLVVSLCCCCVACSRKQNSNQDKMPINYTDKAIIVINEQLPEIRVSHDELPSYESAVDTKQQVV